VWLSADCEVPSFAAAREAALLGHRQERVEIDQVVALHS